MSNPDRFFAHLLSLVPDEVVELSREAAGYSGDIMDSIDRHFEFVVSSLRDTLKNTPWLPDSIKPPVAPLRRMRPPPPSPSYLDQVQDWISKNRAITAAIIGFLGTGTFIIWHRRRLYRQKRRARRAANGAKTEVIVLAGSPHSPLTRTLSLDLERRGFVIYIPVNTLSEERAIKTESRPDIHPLHLDITSPISTASALENLFSHLKSSNPLHLASLILLPSYPSTFPVRPLTALPASTWSDTLNTHLLYPFALTYAFLPLLLSQSTNCALSPRPFLSTIWPLSSPPITHPPTSILLLTPSITPSLHPPNSAPETITTSALDSWLRTLRAETSSSQLTVTHVKLGAFDLQPPVCNQIVATNRKSPHEQFSEITKHGGRAGSLRELHNGIFDAVVGGSGGTVFLGRGSWAYDFVGKWVPDGVVRWMMRRGRGREVLDEGSNGWEHL